MRVRIPNRTDLPSYELQTVLDGVTYTLRFRWSSRQQMWFMDVLTREGEPIEVGRGVVLGPLWLRTSDARVPPGLFFVEDTSNTDSEAGLNDLGDRVQLTYRDVADVRKTLGLS